MKSIYSVNNELNAGRLTINWDSSKYPSWHYIDSKRDLDKNKFTNQTIYMHYLLRKGILFEIMSSQPRKIFFGLEEIIQQIEER